MKRIKSVNGYTIMQAISARDEANYNCHIGEYNIYLSSDIRDFGLSNSYPEWGSIETLSVAEAMCGASKYAVAVDLAEEISGSTAQDMDLVLEVERLLEGGLSIEEVRARFIRDDEGLYEVDPQAYCLTHDQSDFPVEEETIDLSELAQTVHTDAEPTYVEPLSRDRKADLFNHLLGRIIDLEYEDGDLIETLRGLSFTDDEIRACCGDLVDESKLGPVGLDRGGAQPVHVEYSDGSDGFEEPRYSVYYEGNVFPEDDYGRGGVGIARNYHMWGKAFDLYCYCMKRSIPVWVDDNHYGVTFANGEWN